jgi:hypothetical protein
LDHIKIKNASKIEVNCKRNRIFWIFTQTKFFLGGENANVFQSLNNLEQFDSIFHANQKTTVGSFAIKLSFEHKLIFFMFFLFFYIITIN